MKSTPTDLQIEAARRHLADQAARGSDLAVLAIIAALIGVLVAGYVVLALAGRDTLQYAAFAGGPLVAGIIGTLLNRRTMQIARDVAVVKEQTNGLLTNQFAAASTERQDIAAVQLEATGAAGNPPPA